MTVATTFETADFVIGKFYKVPCVRAQYYKKVADWPVIGPKHEDHEFFDFPYQHYHIDWRFVPPALFAPLGYEMGAPLLTSKYINQSGLPQAVMRRRRMHRPLVDFARVRGTKFWPKFVEAYADCKLKPGLICPHRGVSLAGGFQEGDVVTCPAHGLRWNIKTMELVK